MTEKKTPPAELALAATGDGKVVVGGDDKGELKSLGGSDSDSWNNILANQAYSYSVEGGPFLGKGE